MKSRVTLLVSVLLALGLLSWMAGCDREEPMVTAPVVGSIDPSTGVDDPIELNVSADEVNAAGRAASEQVSPDKANACIYLSVPYFSQLDPAWKDVALGFNYPCGNSTIGKYGCHLTCLAMLYKKWGYSSMTPVVLNNWSYQGRAHYAFSTSECGDLIRLPEALQYGYMSRPYRNIAYTQIYNELVAGRPVVARVSFGTTPSHYLVIYAYNGTNYLVRDPWGQSSRVLYGTIRSLLVYGA
jgi:hypothetical protein